MKVLKLMFVLLVFSCLKVHAQYVNIPDTNFRNWIKSLSYNAISESGEFDTTNRIVTNFMKVNLDPNINDLEGIQYFDSLRILTGSGNSNLKAATMPPLLEEISFENYFIDTLNITAPALRKLICRNCHIQIANILPPLVMDADLSENLIDTLNILSASALQNLYVSQNQIRFIQNLPPTLNYIDISYNQLTSLNNLPFYLKAINASANQLQQIDSLNQSLESLIADANAITAVPQNVPSTLACLSLNFNNIDSVISLPASLDSLSLKNNNLSFLQSISDSLGYIDISNNPVSMLPDLKNLVQLNCNNTSISCLPRLPQSLQVLNAEGSAIVCIPNLPPFLKQNLPLCIIPFSYSENQLPGSSCTDDTLSVLIPGASYRWNTGDTTAYVDSACRDIYHCEIITSENCFYADDIDLTIPLTVSKWIEFDCYHCLKYVGLKVDGGTPPYNYSWSIFNSPAANITGAYLPYQCAGFNNDIEYEVTVTDALNDSIVEIIYIGPSFDLSGTGGFYDVRNPTCNKVNDGHIYDVVGCPNNPCMINLFWQNNLSAGSYSYYDIDFCNPTINTTVLTTTDVCYTTQMEKPQCGLCNGTITMHSDAVNFYGVNIYDTLGNFYESGQLCAETIYICEFYIDDGQNINYIETDTIIFHDSSCTPVFPGDANNDGIADNLDLLSIGIAYGDSGITRVDTSVTWSAHNAGDWINSFANAINHKHADSNGDAVINDADTNAIILNYAQTHNRIAPVQYLANIPTLSIVLPDTLLPDNIYNVPLTLGNALDSAYDLYGLAFSIGYDNALLEPGYMQLTIDSSWLGINGSDQISIQVNDTNAGMLDIAITRIDHTNRTGAGELGMLQFKTKSFLTTNELYLTTINITGISNNESYLTINGTVDSSLLQSVVCTMSVTTSASNSCNDWCGGSVQLQVNDPAGGLHYDWSSSVFDTVHCIPVLPDSNEITGLPSGNYQCVITDALGCVTTASVTVLTEENSLVANANYQYEGCTSCNGFIDLTVTGGFGPYLYDWSNSLAIGNNPHTVEDLTGLCFYFNVFSCLITDSIGCTQQYYQEGPDCGFNYQIDVTDETCPGNSDGIISISGNNWPTFCPFGYLFNGNGGIVDASAPVEFTNLGAGTYPVTLISPNTCDTAFAQVVVEHLPEPSVQLQSVLPHCGLCDGTTTVFVDGDTTGTFTNFWWALSNNNSTTESGLCGATDYEYDFVDLNNCFYSGIVNLNCDSSIINGVTVHSNSLHDLTIIPNPNNGTFILWMAKPCGEHSSLEIYNSLGECVMHDNIVANSSHVSVDKNNLPSGLYLCRLISGDRVEQVCFVKE